MGPSLFVQREHRMSIQDLTCVVVIGFTVHGAYPGGPTLFCTAAFDDTPVRLSLGLDDIDAEVRLEAVARVAKIGGKAAAAKLAEIALFDDDAAVREEAVYGLGDIGGEATVLPTLEKALFDPEPVVRQAAVEVVIEIGGEIALGYVLQATADEDAAVRDAAAEVLDQPTSSEP
jgi:HEAT repeat protein